MPWKEKVDEWELTITDNVDGVAIGSGKRIFIESPDTTCTTTLPSIGDSFINPVGNVTYSGIKCSSINYKRTHSAGANGLTATVDYVSPELQQSQEQQREDREAGSFNADIVTLNVQGGTTWWWYIDNAQSGTAVNFPIDVSDGGPCAENLPLTVMQIQRTKRITFNSDNALDAWIPKIQEYGGKLNDSDFLGFSPGQVLLGGVTGSKNNGKWDVDIVFIIRRVNDDSVTEDDWNYMPSDANGETVYNRPVKSTIIHVTEGQGYVIAEGHKFMYDYADISKILETSGPEEE